MVLLGISLSVPLRGRGPAPSAPAQPAFVLPPRQDLKKYGATTVVRVCEVTYDKAPLEKDGITVVVRASGAGSTAAGGGRWVVWVGLDWECAAPCWEALLRATCTPLPPPGHVGARAT